MKCVCPMGGDRTCPNDCPLAVWATLSPKDRKAQRKPIVERLYKQGFTMEAIATQLGASVGTISGDLANFSTPEKLKPAKTSSNPKGAGRPKGSRKPRPRQTDPVKDTIAAMADQGVSSDDIAKTVGVSARAVRHAIERVRIKAEGRADPEIERTLLSMTAQEKLDAAVRQHKHRLDLEFEARVQTTSMERLNSVTLPHYKKEIERMERLIIARRGVMDKATYNKIRWCLHSDHVQDSALKRRYDEAFTIFNNLEKLLLDEKHSPTQFRKLPGTFAELMAMRAKMEAERRAKRNGKADVSRPIK